MNTPKPQPSTNDREIAKWRKRAIQNRDSLDYYRGKAQRLTEENYALRNHSDAAPDMHAEIVWLKQQLETANETAEVWADRALTAERNYREIKEETA